jgi:hypothetical protein
MDTELVILENIYDYDEAALRAKQRNITLALLTGGRAFMDPAIYAKNLPFAEAPGQKKRPCFFRMVIEKIAECL